VVVSNAAAGVRYGSVGSFVPSNAQRVVTPVLAQITDRQCGDFSGGEQDAR
jgi:hypothetical protein